MRPAWEQRREIEQHALWRLYRAKNVANRLPAVADRLQVAHKIDHTFERMWPVTQRAAVCPLAGRPPLRRYLLSTYGALSRLSAIWAAN